MTMMTVTNIPCGAKLPVIALIAGFYGMNYVKELGYLGIFLIFSLLLGLLLRKPVIKLNDAFTEKLESTHLI